MTAQELHRLATAEFYPRKRPNCGLQHRGGCSGRLQCDHILEQAWIKEEWKRANGRANPGYRQTEAMRALRGADLEELLSDGRNGWFLCMAHHELKTRVLLRPRLNRLELPARLIEFIQDHGLGVMFGRRIPA